MARHEKTRREAVGLHFIPILRLKTGARMMFAAAAWDHGVYVARQVYVAELMSDAEVLEPLVEVRRISDCQEIAMAHENTGHAGLAGRLGHNLDVFRPREGDRVDGEGIEPRSSNNLLSKQRGEGVRIGAQLCPFPLAAAAALLASRVIRSSANLRSSLSRAL